MKRMKKKRKNLIKVINNQKNFNINDKEHINNINNYYLLMKIVKFVIFLLKYDEINY